MAKRQFLFLLALAVAAGGCTTKLETGYEPKKLGSLTPAERRGLYAQDFSMESRAAEADQEKENKSGADLGTGMPGGAP
jgi:hypothetical protein